MGLRCVLCGLIIVYRVRLTRRLGGRPSGKAKAALSSLRRGATAAWQSHLYERGEWGDIIQAMAFGRFGPTAAPRVSATYLRISLYF